MVKKKTSYARRKVIIFRHTKVRRDDRKIATTTQMKSFYDTIFIYQT